MNTKIGLCVGVVAFLALVEVGSAHHSFAGFYAPDRIIEVEGVLTEISWRNPHGRLGLDVSDEAGGTTHWSIETGSISVLRARGLESTFAKVGDRVRLAGEASVRSETAMYARQMLLPDGREVMLSIGIAPRWTNAETGELLAPVVDERVASEARRKADGIFRVWSTVLDDPVSFPMFKGGYPLTENGKRLLEQWDPSSAALNDCTTKAMPLLMITPLPLEFVRDGADIVIRFEEDDAVRRIYMGSATPPSEHEFLGHSRGRWQGDTLVVETTHLQAGLFDPAGVQQSEKIRLVERFTPEINGTRLDYRITIEDPDMFTEAFDLSRYFVWRPELLVNEYDCAPQPQPIGRSQAASR
jgi:hypothetical protein